MGDAPGREHERRKARHAPMSRHPPEHRQRQQQQARMHALGGNIIPVKMENRSDDPTALEQRSPCPSDPRMRDGVKALLSDPGNHQNLARQARPLGMEDAQLRKEKLLLLRKEIFRGSTSIFNGSSRELGKFSSAPPPMLSKLFPSSSSNAIGSCKLTHSGDRPADNLADFLTDTSPESIPVFPALRRGGGAARPRPKVIDRFDEIPDFEARSKRNYSVVSGRRTTEVSGAAGDRQRVARPTSAPSAIKGHVVHPPLPSDDNATADTGGKAKGRRNFFASVQEEDLPLDGTARASRRPSSVGRKASSGNVWTSNSASGRKITVPRSSELKIAASVESLCAPNDAASAGARPGPLRGLGSSTFRSAPDQISAIATFSPVIVRDSLSRCWTSSSRLARESRESVVKVETSKASAPSPTSAPVREARKEAPATAVKKVKKLPPPVWVTYHYAFSKKTGLGFLLSNGTMGVVFDDHTKVVHEPAENAFTYLGVSPAVAPIEGDTGWAAEAGEQQPSPARYDLDYFPFFLKKKVAILKHFLERVPEAVKERSQTQPREGLEMTGGEGKDARTQGQPQSRVVVDKWHRRRTTSLFRLSDKTVQVLFDDGSEILLSDDVRDITFVANDGTRETLPLNMTQQRKDIMKRIHHAKDVIFEVIESEKHE